MNAAELLDSLVSLPTLLLAILFYGFAPGFLLRLLVLMYKRDDPRRAELIAELYEVPRLKRPFWVAEQIETAIFDGLGPRIHWALTGRIILRWKLQSGVKQNRLHPASFWIPSEDEKAEIEPGSMVKLVFLQSDGWAERMWVFVEEVRGSRMTGYLANDPLEFPRLRYGRKIKFRREHVIDIDPAPHTYQEYRQHTYTLCDGCRSTNEPDATATRKFVGE